jgi:eukaryotic-like serine/threonine-protein kinase
VYVRPFPAVDRGLWQVSRGGATHPLWARNGRELFYLAQDGLMSVTVEPGSSFLFGAPSLVLKGAMETYWLSTNGRAFDIDSDGQRFLMLKADERAVAQIHVVLHWFEELKRLVPTD